MDRISWSSYSQNYNDEMKTFRQIVFRVTGIAFFTVAVINIGISQDSSKLLLALSKADHTLAIVDPVNLKILARVPVGEDPHEVVASPDGKTAYVTIYGGGTLHELNVIDLTAQKAQPGIDTRPLFGPHDVAFANGKLWFTAEGSKAIGRYDPSTGKVDWSMGTGQNRTHMIHVSSDGRKIYTTNVSSGAVSILTDTLIQPGRFTPAN